MSDILSIGSSAVAAYQRALGTVSNNIANVGTEGYVRQETSMSENMPRQQGKIYLGTGVNVAGIKRAYDQFLEQNLRNSTSEVNTQGPMVDYANRVVDIMASETVGLPPALDKFFGTARQLSVDPASNILRAQFLRDADGLASRFRELSTQMQGVDTETREAISTKVADINTLAGQIAVVNKQLAGKTYADRQPPDLLDQRDLLLTKLSKLVKVNVTTAVNGSVGVSIGNMSGAGLIVDRDRAVALGVKFDETDLSRVSIIADPYGKTPEEISGISSGELGGLMGFREQV
ncbi:MAG: flagellar hook-associated protein FlgK, partial [Betaproteobacteria bacterium]|nr:flagellar hook-associated protein FlgK [Betaproteobacteria bacterium]